MPRRNGCDVLRELRAHASTPVLMLTARGEDVDSLVGLELGAHDYLAKPCNPRVLVARIRAILRHATEGYAAGDLSRRVAPSPGTRRDESVDLAIAFDRMAERLSGLIFS